MGKSFFKPFYWIASQKRVKGEVMRRCTATRSGQTCRGTLGIGISRIVRDERRFGLKTMDGGVNFMAHFADVVCTSGAELGRVAGSI